MSTESAPSAAPAPASSQEFSNIAQPSAHLNYAPSTTSTNGTAPAAATAAPAASLAKGGYLPWKQDMFGCSSDLPFFAKSFCCPCIGYSEIAPSYLNVNSQDALVQNGVLTCFHMGWAETMLLRRHIRSLAGIQGNTLEDIYLSACCQPCVLSQMMHETQNNPALASPQRITM